MPDGKKENPKQMESCMQRLRHRNSQAACRRQRAEEAGSTGSAVEAAGLVSHEETQAGVGKQS